MINKTLKLILDCVLKVLCILFHNNLSGISYVKSNILTSSVNFLSVYFSLIKSHFTRQFFYKSILLIFTYFRSDCFLTLKISSQLYRYTDFLTFIVSRSFNMYFILLLALSFQGWKMHKTYQYLNRKLTKDVTLPRPLRCPFPTICHSYFL